MMRFPLRSVSGIGWGLNMIEEEYDSEDETMVVDRALAVGSALYAILIGAGLGLEYSGVLPNALDYSSMLITGFAVLLVVWLLVQTQRNAR